MNPIEISIIIPSMQPMDKSPIFQSFLQRKEKSPLYVQFIFLLNTKTPTQSHSEVKKYSTHETICIPNDRYFGSCEENLYRVQDFASILKDKVFCVGEHDAIDWSMLETALDFYASKRLQAMAWNVMSVQLQAESTQVENPALIRLRDENQANEIIDLLYQGKSINSSLGFSALLSIYGPIDWAAYLGNHIYDRNVFIKLLQYKFSEHVYSFVYKQARAFDRFGINYGFFSESVIHRISSEFLKMQRNEFTGWGWLEEHRIVHGHSPIFWTANLSHLVQLESDSLFQNIAYSLCLSQAPTQDSVEYRRNSMLVHSLSWAGQVISKKINAPSHYLPNQAQNASLQDVRYVKNYLELLLKTSKESSAIETLITSKALNQLQLAAGMVTHHLEHVDTDDDLLILAFNAINRAMENVPPESLTQANEQSFSEHFHARLS